MTLKYECKLCNKKFTSKGFGYHLLKSHPPYTTQQYYDEFIAKDGEGFCSSCGKKLKNFVGLQQGYTSTLCVRCASLKSREKAKNTSINRYGVDHPAKSVDVKNKSVNTNLKKYGVSHWKKNKKMKDKADEKLKEKYGVDNVSQLENVKEKRKETYVKNYVRKILPAYLKKINMDIISDYTNLNTDMTFKCRNCGYIFKDNLFNINQRLYPCPKCRNYSRSISEQEIVNFVDQLNISFEINVRNIIPPKELDIYIPSKRIAIEFNGLYWHSEEMGCDRNYHLEKTKKCQENDIQLVHIFEDEWLLKQDIVKNRLKQILGVSDARRIHARKCKIKEIDAKVKNEFLEKYHIQGQDRSVIKLGAFYDNELVSVMTFSHGNITKGSKSIEDVWELNRFCSDPKYHIPGIASKLLTFFKRNYEWKEIFSYADRRWSVGNVYEKLGFELDHITQPNYWYLTQNARVRIHRFALRKTIDDLNNKTEKEIRQQEGYMRIWDCGSLKYIINA